MTIWRALQQTEGKVDIAPKDFKMIKLLEERNNTFATAGVSAVDRVVFPDLSFLNNALVEFEKMCLTNFSNHVFMNVPRFEETSLDTFNHGHCNQNTSAQLMHLYTSPTTTTSLPTKAKTLSHFEFYTEKLCYRRKAAHWAIHEEQEVPWEKAKKHFASPEMRFQPFSPTLCSPKSRNLYHSKISGTALLSIINVQTSKKVAGMATGREPEGAGSPELKSFAGHGPPASCRWHSLREVEQACKFIATLGGRRDDWRDSKTDLVIAWGDAPVNRFQCISALRGASRHRFKSGCPLILLDCKGLRRWQSDNDPCYHRPWKPLDCPGCHTQRNRDHRGISLGCSRRGVCLMFLFSVRMFKKGCLSDVLVFCEDVQEGVFT
ncbi:hypothetical protein BJ742DRAFT_733864 [Cladochytrium replicatum]|nr:hypothetical protein BJ742DRAFT_733864 [Cladochytrium replicatum]